MKTKTASALLILILATAGCDEPSTGAAKAPADGAAAAAPAPAPKKTDSVLRLGDPLTSAPRVDVEDLFANAEEFKDKRVRVEGVVKDYCHHKRTWFGVTPKGGDLMVRVFARPKFEAPVACKGKRVVAEGVVELLEIPPERVAHYAKEHSFISAEEAASGKTIYQPILRGTGAEFF